MPSLAEYNVSRLSVNELELTHITDLPSTLKLVLSQSITHVYSTLYELLIPLGH